MYVINKGMNKKLRARKKIKEFLKGVVMFVDEKTDAKELNTSLFQSMQISPNIRNNTRYLKSNEIRLSFTLSELRSYFASFW